MTWSSSIKEHYVNYPPLVVAFLKAIEMLCGKLKDEDEGFLYQQIIENGKFFENSLRCDQILNQLLGKCDCNAGSVALFLLTVGSIDTFKSFLSAFKFAKAEPGNEFHRKVLLKCCVLLQENSVIMTKEMMQVLSKKKSVVVSFFEKFMQESTNDKSWISFIIDCAVQMNKEFYVEMLQLNHQLHYHGESAAMMRPPDDKSDFFPLKTWGSFIQPVQFDHDSVFVPQGDETDEYHRFQTFVKFPPHIAGYFRHLAAMGHLYTGYKDRTKCFSCGFFHENKHSDGSDCVFADEWHFFNCQFRLNLIRNASFQHPKPTQNFSDNERIRYQQDAGGKTELPDAAKDDDLKNMQCMFPSLLTTLARQRTQSLATSALDASVSKIEPTGKSQSEIEQLKSEPEKLQSENKHLQSKLEKSQSKIEQLKSEQEKLQSENKHLQSNLEKSQSEIEQLKSKLEKVQNERECKVCYINTADYVLVPCGHTFCKCCVILLTHCPLCRSKFKTYCEIYVGSIFM